MLKRLVAIIKENRSWMFLATFFFALGFFITYSALSREPELFSLLEQTSIPLMRELAELVFSGNPLRGVLILFIHNLTSSLQVIILGLLLGIPALFSAIANGTVLGLVAAQLAQEGIQPLRFLLAGVLPHGVFELPAFLLCAAFGLKLGYHIVFPLPGYKRLASIRLIFREIGYALPVIALLLAIAALLEVLVTPELVKYFLLP
jgi:stage II sporulation protein M